MGTISFIHVCTNFFIVQSKKTQSDIAYCGYQRLYSEGSVDFSLEYENDELNEDRDIHISSFDEEMAISSVFSSVWRGLYRTDLIKDIKFLSKRNGQDFLWSAYVLLRANQIVRIDKNLYKWRKRKGSESYLAFRYRMLDYLYVKCCTIELLKKRAPEWIVPYTLALYTHCIDAANRIPQLSDSSDKERYRVEIKKALSYFREISIVDILRNPYSSNLRKLLAVTGKISIPLACFIKKNLLKVINHF